MDAIASLVDELTLVVIGVGARDGGMPLPQIARVVPVKSPRGADAVRKFSVMRHLVHYVRVMAREAYTADVVHVPVPGDIQFLGMLVALVLRKKLIVRYCGSWLPTSRTTMMNRITRCLMRLCAGGRNVMFATGTGAEPPGRGIHWIFATAISRSELTSVQADLDRPLNSPVQLVYVGRLSPEKGIADLVRAFGITERAPALSHRFSLVIAGDGPERTSLSRLAAQEHCDHSIQFSGQLNRADLMKMMSGMDVCVLPSWSESFCKARLDAMLCGMPVVTTEVGFGRDLVGRDGERGWLVPPGDEAALALRLKDLLSRDVDWPSLRRRCRAFVEERTLETWALRIGSICAEQWKMPFVGGKLR